MARAYPAKPALTIIEPSELNERLAAQALAVCRRYLSNGRRLGNYWVVGDVRNTPGRSMYVRLFPDGGGHKAGRWADAATGEYGDLLDIIRLGVPFNSFPEALAEAEAFLGNAPPNRPSRFRAESPRRSDRLGLARRLYSEGVPIQGTLGEAYLVDRGIDPDVAVGLRFHSACYCRPESIDAPSSWPALVAPVTDTRDDLSAVHRLYLAPNGLLGGNLGKAPLRDPKRSLGRLHGQAVRFGPPAEIIIIAEGIENALSIRTAFPDLTVHAALSAGNLAAYVPLAATTRLVIALDNDDAGWTAAKVLKARTQVAGLSATLLKPRTEDHNLDLRTFGLQAYRQSLCDQIAV